MKKGLTGQYKHSEITKRQMSLAHKGKAIPLEQRQKISASRLARKARLGYLNSPATRQKLSEGRTGERNWNFGKPRSEATKKHIGDAERGSKNHMWHRHHSPQARAKISTRHSGSGNWNWKGGISKSPKHLRFLHKRRKLRKLGNGGSHTLAEWEALKAQYNWTCPACTKCEPVITLTEDHIIPISKGGSDNIENIQPLCQSCNSKKYVQIIFYSKP
jgi:5-methylcytosine-specific restriction endonuclease McrA